MRYVDITLLFVLGLIRVLVVLLELLRMVVLLLSYAAFPNRFQSVKCVQVVWL